MTTLKVNVIRKPTIKIKVLPNFPSSVSVTAPILLNRTGGNYAFSLDIAALDASIISGLTIDGSQITTGTLPTGRFPALTGDVTTTLGSITTTIPANTVTNAKAAQMAANTVKGNNTASTANSADLTIAQASLLLGINVTTRTALKALDTTQITRAYLTELGREGAFVWKAGNFSTVVTADTQEGIWIKANAIASSSGAWERIRTDGVYNVKWFGALGNFPTTDDATAIQAAINLAGTNAGGDVLFPQGGYRIDTGLTISTPLTRLIGVGKRYCSIQTTVTTITLITISAARCGVANLSIFAQVVPSGTPTLITMASGAVQCTISDLDMVGGSFCFKGQVGSTDVLISDCVMRQAFNGASVYTQGAGAYVFDRCLFNQDWPVAVPTSANDKGARANTTAYVANDYVTLSGMILQCLVAGTSGGSPPSLTGIWYNTTIVDGAGSLRWKIAGNASGVGAQVDSVSSYITFKDCDFTGAYIYGAQITNGLGTTQPDVTRFHNCTTGGITTHGFNIVAAKGTWIEGCEIQACVGAGAARSGVVVGSSVTGETIIRGNRVTSGFVTGVLLQNATFGSCLVTQNEIFGLTTGVSIAANVNDFIVSGNNLGASAVYGNNTTGVTVAAGTSNNYQIIGNRLNGLGTFVSDGGTGISKMVDTGVGIGYAIGSGGAVTQLTSRTTTVILNKPSGAITLFSAAGSATPAQFTVTNSAVAATDTISISAKSGTNKYRTYITAVAAGSFEIGFETTGGTSTDSPVFNFNVIKGVAA